MDYFHFSADFSSRGKDQSHTSLASYISGQKLHDYYKHETFYQYREDVLYCKIVLPDHSPTEFYDLQNLCHEIDKADKQRKNARTTRIFVGSLPNKLPLKEQICIVNEFVDVNFTKHGLGAIIAIHEGRNDEDPSKNNPHMHIIVTTRSVEPEGFCKNKYREWNKKIYIDIWRIQWAKVQNQALKRNNIIAEVSPYSLKAQGCKRKPIPYLSICDYQKEKRGIRTIAGEKRRKVIKYNKKISREKKHNKEYEFEIEM